MSLLLQTDSLTYNFCWEKKNKVLIKWKLSQLKLSQMAYPYAIPFCKHYSKDNMITAFWHYDATKKRSTLNNLLRNYCPIYFSIFKKGCCLWCFQEIHRFCYSWCKWKNLKVLIGDLDVNKLFLIKSSQQRKHENLCQFVDLGTGGLCTLYNYLKHDKKASK